MISLSRAGGAAACVAVLLFSATSAWAERVCPPGTGLHCGSGRVDPGSSTYYDRNQRIAAGMEAAGALVTILSTLAGIVERSAPSPQIERDVIREREQGERVEECRAAAAWAASGARQLKVGDEKSAEAHFAAAVQHAQNGHCGEPEVTYERLRHLARARHALNEALIQIGSGAQKIDYDYLLRLAQYEANVAEQRDLAARIEAYRREAHEKTGKGQPFKKKTSCVEVNGQMMCD